MTREGVAGQGGVDVEALRIGWCYKYILVQKGQFIRIWFSNLSFIYMLGHRSQSSVPSDEDVMMVVI